MILTTDLAQSCTTHVLLFTITTQIYAILFFGTNSAIGAATVAGAVSDLDRLNGADLENILELKTAEEDEDDDDGGLNNELSDISNALYNLLLQNEDEEQNEDEIEKRFSEFLGGKRKRFSEFLGGKKKRFSEFLGGKKKRFSEFLGGKKKRFSEFLGGKRSSFLPYTIAESLNKRFSEFLGGKRSKDLDNEKRFSEFLGGK